MNRHVLVVLLAVGWLVSMSGCTKKVDEATSPPPSSQPSSPESKGQAGKKRIPNIASLSLERVKGYYDECLAFNDIGHPQVPYVIEDCRSIRARWDRRDMAKQSNTKSVPRLPTLH